MAERILGYCPECGRPLRRMASHGSAAVQQQYPELSRSQAQTHLAMEMLGVEKGRESFRKLVVEASRQLMISKVKEQLSSKFDEKLDNLAEEMVDFIVKEKKMKKDFWKQKISMEDEVFQAFSELFAA